MEQSKDIEVKMTFLKPEEGGRRIPAKSGYPPQFYYNNQDWDAIHKYIDADEAYPGQTVRAYLSFLSTDMHTDQTYPGMEFLIREGSRTVARGRVLRSLDLEQSVERVRSKR